MDELSAVREALEPVSATLDADGYELRLSGTGSALRLEVLARSDACAECLVPQEAFTAIVRTQLGKRELHPQIELVYPDASSASH